MYESRSKSKAHKRASMQFIQKLGKMKVPLEKSSEQFSINIQQVIQLHLTPLIESHSKWKRL